MVKLIFNDQIHIEMKNKMFHFRGIPFYCAYIIHIVFQNSLQTNVATDEKSIFV